MNLVKIFQDIPTIEAKTVNLRKLKSEDAYDLFQYYKNEFIID